MHNISNILNKQIVINICKIYPISKFRGLMPVKLPLFSWFRQFAPPIAKISPFLAKMGNSVVYVWSGVGGPGMVCMRLGQAYINSIVKALGLKYLH